MRSHRVFAARRELLDEYHSTVLQAGLLIRVVRFAVGDALPCFEVFVVVHDGDLLTGSDITAKASRPHRERLRRPAVAEVQACQRAVLGPVGAIYARIAPDTFLDRLCALVPSPGARTVWRCR